MSMQNYQSGNQQRRAHFYDAPVRQQFDQQLQKTTPSGTEKKVKLTHTQKEKAFYVDNVENVSDLHINAPGLKYQVSRTATNNYKVQYFPKGEEHTVDVKYEGAHVDGSPFLLAPSPPKMVFDHDEGLFSVENVHDVEKLQIKSDTLPYEMFRDKDSSTTYHVKYEAGKQIHDVDVIYDKEEVKKGSFRLVPKEMKEAYMRDQEQGTLANKFDHVDLNAPGELLWEHTPENVYTQPIAQQIAAEQPEVMANSEKDEDLIYEHIPQKSAGHIVPTLYQQPPQSRRGAFY